MAEEITNSNNARIRGSNVLRTNSWSNGNESGEDSELLNDNENDEKNQTPRYCRRSTPRAGDCYYNMAGTLGEERMRRKLRFFFMNPIEKWQAKRKIPYKFITQVIKIILVTVQLCLFGHSNYIHVDYSWDNKIAFSHLFLKGWDATQEVAAYPPATGPLALYKQDEFFKTINYALDGYYNLNNAIGSYSYPTYNNSVGQVKFCIHEFMQGKIFGFNESYVFDSKINITCVNITHKYPKEKNFSSRQFFDDKKINITFSSLVKADLEFAVKTVNFKAAGPITPPDCYQFDIKIDFDNTDHGGQMLLSLDAEPIKLECNGETRYITDDEIESALRTLLNALVILICTISLILCSRAIWKAQLLKRETIKFFHNTYGKSLSVKGRLEFLNLWYIMIIINDLLIITGSIIKQQIEQKHYSGDQWNICSVFLGTGNLLVWFGVLRYLGFFKTYNVVILTLKKAAPKVARFLLCAIIIYAGFTFCGWLVLGPYHIKFRTLASTSECLFALINGDDMFATFSIMTFKSPMLWWFLRIYLYSFISLFIYVVLSLFISIIMDAYDTIKLCYRDGFPKSDLQAFIAVCKDEASSGTWMEEADDSGITEFFDKICCCRKKPYDNFHESRPSTTNTNESEPICNAAICI